MGYSHCDKTSPTRTDVYDILVSNKYIQWSTVPPKLKERLIQNALDEIGPNFGPWREFYTFYLKVLVNYIKVRLPNQRIVGEGHGC